MEDKKFIPVSELLVKLHHKFEQNFATAKPFAEFAANTESKARVLGLVRGFLERKAALKHQREIAAQFDEIFSDSTIAVYLAFIGLDVPARMLARRSLELGLVLLSAWDRPADYWAWKSHDEDVSFSKLLAHISSGGFKSFVREEGHITSDFDKAVSDLPVIYSELSNVVHPKVYNFETGNEAAFNITQGDLRETLRHIENMQRCLLTLLGTRFRDFDIATGKEKG